MRPLGAAVHSWVWGKNAVTCSQSFLATCKFTDVWRLDAMVVTKERATDRSNKARSRGRALRLSQIAKLPRRRPSCLDDQRSHISRSR
jgi:hypothetical protein